MFFSVLEKHDGVYVMFLSSVQIARLSGHGAAALFRPQTLQRASYVSPLLPKYTEAFSMSLPLSKPPMEKIMALPRSCVQNLPENISCSSLPLQSKRRL
jgi:hypothetical protein